MKCIRNRILSVLLGFFVLFNVCHNTFAVSRVSEGTKKVGQVVCERKFGIPVSFSSFEYVIAADFLAKYMKRYVESYGIKSPNDGGHYEVLRRNPFEKYEIVYNYNGCGDWCIMFYIPLSKQDSYDEDVDYIDDSDGDSSFSSSFDDDFDDDFDFVYDSLSSKYKKDEASLCNNRRKLASDLSVFYSYNVNCEDFRKELRGDRAKGEFERYLKESRKFVKKKGSDIKSAVSKIEKVFRRSSNCSAVGEKRKLFYDLIKYLNKKDLNYNSGYGKDGGDYLPSLVGFLCDKENKKSVKNFNELKRIVDGGEFDEKKYKGYYRILLDYYRNKLVVYSKILRYINKYIDDMSSGYRLFVSCFENLGFSTDVRVITTEIRNVVKEQKRVDIG